MAAKDGAAREIALAFGVPPMLLGIPGDNTYANYQEAIRAFWRHTVLPLCGRLAEAIGGWLAPAFGDGAGLRLWYDADQVEALSSARGALWARVGAADFLTVDGKRAAVGYGPVEGGEGWADDWRTDGRQRSFMLCSDEGGAKSWTRTLPGMCCA